MVELEANPSPRRSFYNVCRYPWSAISDPFVTLVSCSSFAAYPALPRFMTLSIQISPLAHYSHFLTTTLPSSSFRVACPSPPPLTLARDGKSKKAFFELGSRESVNYCCELLLLLLLVFDVWAREYLLKDWEFFFFLIREERGGIDYDWRGSIERGGGGGEKKAQRGGWRVSKGERKKLTDATCLKGGVWGRSRRGLSRCVESSWVVGNNKFYARYKSFFFYVQI